MARKVAEVGELTSLEEAIFAVSFVGHLEKRAMSPFPPISHEDRVQGTWAVRRALHAVEVFREVNRG